MSEQLAFESAPQARSLHVIDFEHVSVPTLESFPPQYLVIVTGIKPCVNMQVDLVPLVYVAQPEYWGIEVVGRVPGGICLPALAPYEATLLNPPLGFKGIEIIGATRSERIEIPSVAAPQGFFSLSITSKATGELVAKTTLTCNPDGGSHPRAVDAAAQMSKVEGCIEAIAADEGPCPHDFNPVIMRAHGTWDGADRRFVGEYANPCVGRRATGGVVFDFYDRQDLS